jgi:hypothetical protein
MGKDSHYSSKKDRVFVRGMQGQYSLREELAWLRAMPRVIKGKKMKFVDGPQFFMNMLFQKSVIPRPTEAAAGGVGFEPRHNETNHNHDE